MREKLGKFFSSWIITFIEGFFTIAFSIFPIFALTRIPVISIGTMITGQMPFFVHLLVLFFAADLLLMIAKRSPTRIILVIVAVVGFFSAVVISEAEFSLAKAENVNINYRDAIWSTEDHDFSADIEVDSYLNVNGTDYGLSIWTPKNQEDPDELAPIIVYFHGGAWVEGDRFDIADMSHCKYMSEHGYLVLNVDYPLSTVDNPIWKDQENYIAEIFPWLKEHAEEYGGDIDHIGMSGVSAGGNIAINIATKANNGTLEKVLGEEVPQVEAIAPLYPGVDAEAVYTDADPLLKGWMDRLIRIHFGGSPSSNEEAYQSISSAEVVDEATPPTIYGYGDADHIIPGKSTYHAIEKLEASKVELKIVDFPYADHGFDYPGTTGCQIWETVMTRWFDDHLKEG